MNADATYAAASSAASAASASSTSGSSAAAATMHTTAEAEARVRARFDELRPQVAAACPVKKDISVRTWQDFFRYDQTTIPIEVWFAMEQPTDAEFNERINMQPYRDYLNEIDAYTAMLVHDRTQDLLMRLRHHTRTNPHVMINDQCKYEWNGRGNFVERYHVELQCAEIRFTESELEPLRKRARNSAIANNTPFLLDGHMRYRDAHGKFNFWKTLDADIADYHMDYTSASSFITTAVQAVRRITHVARYALQTSCNVIALWDALYSLFRDIIPKSLAALGARHGGMRTIVRLVMALMQTPDDTFVPDLHYVYASHDALQEASRALKQHPDDASIRIDYYTTRRVASETVVEMDGQVRVNAILVAIWCGFKHTEYGYYAHPSFIPTSYDQHGTVNIHRALTCLLLAGANPATLTTFIHKWDPLRTNPTRGFDPVDFDDHAAANQEETFCIPLVCFLRQLGEWGDLTAHQMVALDAYLNHPLNTNMHLAHDTHVGLEIAQILTSIPTTCNLFRVCMGHVRRGTGEFVGTEGARRVRQLVLTVRAKFASVDLMWAHNSDWYPRSPFFYDEDGARNGRFHYTRLFVILHHFHYIDLRRTTHKDVVDKIRALDTYRSTTHTKIFIYNVACHPHLLMGVPRPIMMGLRTWLDQFASSDNAGNRGHECRLVAEARKNVDRNYFAQHRTLVTVALSQLFASRRRPPTADAPFSRHVPATVALLIVRFLTCAVNEHGVSMMLTDTSSVSSSCASSNAAAASSSSAAPANAGASSSASHPASHASTRLKKQQSSKNKPTKALTTRLLFASVGPAFAVASAAHTQ